MTGAILAERLVAAGLDAGELPAKARLYDRTLAAFRESTGGEPEYVSWVPGRLEVFGTHTDYAGGRTLVCALPRGFALVGGRRPSAAAAKGPSLWVADAVAGTSIEVRREDAGVPPAGAGGWRRYVAAVANRLARNFPGAALDADLVFASDLPRAAGMSSSSALMVSVARALIALGGLRARPEWRTSIGGLTDEAGYYACIENGRTFGDLVGDAGVGTHGGSEDHAAMVCGQPRTLSAFAFVPMRQVAAAPMPAAWRFVVATSGVAARKTAGALEPYNRLSHGAAALLDLWNRFQAPAPSLAAALGTSPAAADRLQFLIRTEPVAGWPGPWLDARLRHFAREDARVPAAVDAFREGRSAALTTLATESQADAQDLLENQVEETADLAAAAGEYGAFAARSFGAGFGGSVWALADADRAEDLAARWLEAYRARRPEAVAAATFVARPSPSALELTEP